MELSPRLKIIADSIIHHEKIADIGSDHAYLAIHLIQNKKADAVIATDVNKGPIEISKKKIKKYHLEKLIETRLGNGLSVLQPGEVDAAVIAGMGGALISEILESGLNVAQSCRKLIIQPMSESEKVRKWLLDHGFEITDEELVRDEHKIYEVIWAAPSKGNAPVGGYMLIGEKIIEKKHPLAGTFIDMRINEMIKVIGMLENKDTDNCRAKMESCKKLLAYYKEVRKWV